MQKRHSLFFVLLLSILLSACQPASAPTHHWRPTSTRRPSVTISPTVLTSTPTLTLTPSPTYTTSPTATPHPPLADEGPYLAYVSNKGDIQSLTFINADGSGLKRIPMPTGDCVYWSASSLSPDGKWLAFYTGSAGELDTYYCQGQAGRYDLQLNLMDTSSGESFVVTGLLGPDYPANFNRIVPEVLETDPYWNDIDFWGGTRPVPEDVAREINTMFAIHIRTLNWSPDSKLLAFAGQMNGDTSDIYLYDVANHAIAQATTGIKQIEWIDWSPDGDYIVHGATNDADGIESTTYVYAVKRDLSAEVELGSVSNLSTIWISQDTMVFYSNGGPGTYRIEFINIETGVKTIIWPYSFNLNFAYDPDYGNLLLVGGDTKNYPAEIPEGLFLANLDGEKKLLFPDWDFLLPYFRGSTSHRFVFEFKDSVYAINSDASQMDVLSDHSSRIYISPNYTWMILWYGQELQLFDQNDRIVRSIEDITVDNIVWRGDEQGVYLINGSKLYVLSIPDGEPVLIDDQVWSDQNQFFRWIP